MRIAFFSYEFPSETGGGGIGTYLKVITEELCSRGHDIVVFCGTNQTEAFWENEYVYRIPATGWAQFNERLPRYFLPLHNTNPFDVAECTDFKACGLSVKKLVPELPIVVKLHTPSFLVDSLLFCPLSFKSKLRFILGGLKRFNLPRLPRPPHASQYTDEFEIVRLAERIHSPSQSIASKMAGLKFSIEGKTEIFPYPIKVASEIKEIQPRLEVGGEPQIVFIGRLESRKGVIDIAEAIPKILKLHPKARFTFVGRPSHSPKAGVDMISYLRSRLKSYLNSISFTGEVDHRTISSYLEKGDIFLFPSHYESFGIVCCEAMAAGKAVIGSLEGGMAEIIQDQDSGLLIRPQSVKSIVQAVDYLIKSDSKRLKLGSAGRTRITEYFGIENVISKQIEAYLVAVNQGSKIC